jgi:hypothetical protein
MFLLHGIAAHARDPVELQFSIPPRCSSVPGKERISLNDLHESLSALLMHIVRSHYFRSIILIAAAERSLVDVF